MSKYDEFTKEFLEKLEDILSHEGIQIRRTEIEKINGNRDGCVISYPGERVALTIYFDDLYGQHTEMGYSPQQIADTQAERIRGMRGNLISVPDFSSGKARDSLYATVINKEKNAELLSRTPHINVGDTDLAVVARYRTGENSSTLVNNEVCGLLQMTSEEVMEIARRNTRNEGYSCRTMTETMGNILADQGMPEEFIHDMMPDSVGPDIYVLTNKSGIEGGVVGTDPEVLSEIRDQIGEDFSILPSSRHELLLVPDSLGMNVRDLEQMVRDVNRQEVSEQDFLSDHVYHVGPSLELTMAGQELIEDLEPTFDKIPSRSH